MPPDGRPRSPETLTALARQLDQAVLRLDAATATLVAAESRADQLVGAVSSRLRDVAEAGQVDVPVMVPPSARNARSLHPAVVEAEHIVRARALELAAQQRRADRWAAAV